MLPDQRLKSLPVPTPEQTAKFAEHVADNHSWYKHPPFFPPSAAFVFFPNPDAGRGVEGEGEPFEVYDIDRGDYFAYHRRSRKLLGKSIIACT